MSTHLEKHHAQNFSLLMQNQQREQPNSSSQPSDEEPTGNVKRRKVGPLDYAFPMPLKRGSPKWTAITQSITNYLVGSMAPIRTVELQSFKEMVRVLQPGYEVPSRKYFSETAIPNAYSSKVQAVRKEMSSSIHYSVTSDAWTSDINMNPYISLTIHFINEEYEFISRNLATVYAPEDHTGKY